MPLIIFANTWENGIYLVPTLYLGFPSSLARRRQWHPTPVLLPGKSHEWKTLVGCSTWGWRVGRDWETSLSLSRIGEGNGNPLQCSCLENPRDGGAWWAAVYGVAQSRTQLKQLSSSSSSLAGKESACNAEDPGSIPGLGRSPGDVIGYLLWYSWASLVAQMVKNAADQSSVPGSGWSPGEGVGNPL